VIKLLRNLTQNISVPTARCLTWFFAAFLIFTIFTLNTANAALDYGTGRIRQCNLGPEGNINVEGLDWDPTTGGKDVEFVMSNPVCFSFAITSYASVKAAIGLMNYACGSGSGLPRVTPTPFLDIYDIGKAIVKGARTPSCAAAIIGANASFGTALYLLSATYLVAEKVYDRSEICGAEWVLPNSDRYNFSTDGHKRIVENQINEWIRTKQTQNLALDNKTYREWYYGGVEVSDNPDGGDVCLDVTQPKVNGEYPAQKYYLKGSDIGNYNCKKYLIQPGQSDPLGSQSVMDSARIAELKSAYECCMRRSKEYICIQYAPFLVEGSSRTFCRAGTRCNLSGITFTAKFADSDRLVCAETYSLCPYNFSVGGGTEYCDYYKDGIWDDDSGRWKMITAEEVANGDCVSNSEIRSADCSYNQKAGKCRNYCQYLTHCTRTSNSFVYTSGITSPYFAEACLNFEGDSQNKTVFDGGFILGSQRHFSAPIAQCVKETLENVFYNRTGHSQCLNLNEFPSAGGVCPSGLYASGAEDFVFKKGNSVKRKSFFSTIQDTLQFAVKLVLTMSVMFYGMNLLVGKADIRNKKDILIYFLKIALVAYFATGDAWQTMFFKGVYNSSMEFSRMVFKIKTGDREELRDGCQFGRLYLEDGTETSSKHIYPDGKEYLAIWDTLDCKIVRYLGFGPEVSAANIAMLVLASFLTGPIGIYLAFSVMIFGLLLLAATIRALHIFLSSAISIIIMVFVSPLVIPLALFERTKGIYEGWLKELISFCLQPMILFAYIAIFIMIMDKTLLGSAEFSGPGPNKTMNCEKKCVNIATNTIVPYVNGVMPNCDLTGQEIIDPLNDSAACLLAFNKFGSFPGFELIGVTIPIVTILFENHVKERVLTLLKAALVMFLIYKFMDEIPGITSSLIGGTKLPGSEANGAEMFMKMAGAARAIQDRLARGALKLAKGKSKDGKKAIRDVSSSGRSEKKVGEDNDDDTASSGGKGGEDSSGSSKGIKLDDTGGGGKGGDDGTESEA
jgi:type IV secretory pathway VirB6-like protein